MRTNYDNLEVIISPVEASHEVHVITPNLKQQAEVMSDYIGILIEFAESQEDFVMAAKLTDVQERFSDRYLEVAD